MKQIILVRHGKSSWNFPVKDFERELTNSGVENSIKVAKESYNFIDRNSCIWSSYANRALSTAKIMVNEWGFDIDSIQIRKDLYTFNSFELEGIVKSCPDSNDSLIVFGHNYAITDFVNKFGDIFIDNVPTSGFVCITFETNKWHSITKGKTTKILFPKEL